MLGCNLASSEAFRFPDIDAELQRRKVNPLFRVPPHGGRIYLFTDGEAAKLPRTGRDEPYLTDGYTGNLLEPIDDVLALYRPLFLPRVDISKRETRFPMEDGSTVILRGMHEGDHDQVFTNESVGSFNVTVALKWAQENMPLVPVTIEVPAALHGLHKNIDLDTNHLMQLAGREFVDVLKETVLLYVLLPNGEHVLIDGHHRLAFLCMCCGRADVAILPARAHMIPLDLADQFKVSYVERWPDGRERDISAEELLVRISGIYSSSDGSIRVDPSHRSISP